MTKDPRGVVTDVKRAKGLISGLHNVTPLENSLSREQSIVVNMIRSFEMTRKMKKRA